MRSSHPEGRSQKEDGGAGSSFRIRCIVACGLEAENGWRPVAIS